MRKYRHDLVLNDFVVCFKSFLFYISFGCCSLFSISLKLRFFFFVYHFLKNDFLECKQIAWNTYIYLICIQTKNFNGKSMSSDFPFICLLCVCLCYLLLFQLFSHKKAVHWAPLTLKYDRISCLKRCFEQTAAKKFKTIFYGKQKYENMRKKMPKSTARGKRWS